MKGSRSWRAMVVWGAVGMFLAAPGCVDRPQPGRRPAATRDSTPTGGATAEAGRAAPGYERLEPRAAKAPPPRAAGEILVDGKPGKTTEQPPMNFNRGIPPALPPFPGGVDGTEFFPDPFFYGEETWDGLEIRLQLYLAYQHKDLAMVAVARNRLEDALDHYRRLEARLAARPVQEVILRDIHRALIDWARRAQCVLLARLGRNAGAAACLERVDWTTTPGDSAWKTLLEAAVQASPETPEPSIRLQARFGQMLPGPPWTPRAAGPAPTMSARHRDRLERLRAYIVWFDPLDTAQPWGDYGPDDAQRALWARALAVTLAAHVRPAERRAAVSALMARVSEAPAVSVDRTRLDAVLSTASPVPLLDALAVAETSVQTLERRQPRTSVARLQGMPTGDSYLDVLGQAGSPPVGKTEKLSLDDPNHRAWTERYVSAINEAIAEGRPGDVGPLLDEMIQALDAYPYDSRYFNIKRVRNEGIRLLVLTGQPDRALALLDGFFPLQDLDYRVPCRKGVLEAMRGRIYLEAGRLDEAESAFSRALAHTERWLGYVDRYRGARTPPPSPAGPGSAPGALR